MMGFLFGVSGGSGGVVGVMYLAGGMAVFLLTGVFLAKGKYRRPPRAVGSAEFERVRREAEAMVAGLSPKMISLAEKERNIGEFAGRRVDVAEVFDEVSGSGVWGRFAVASASVEDDPLSAMEELREVEVVVEAMIAKVCEVEESLEQAFGKEKS